MSKKLISKVNRETLNDDILSEYFLNKSLNNKPIPYMTVICEETGVSNSTISRYAKRKGFYNFAELRANFNKTLDREINDTLDHGLLNFLRDNESFAIITSKSTILVGHHIRERLSALGITAKILPLLSDRNKDDNFTVDKNDVLIVISLSSDSERVMSFVRTHKDKKVFFITTEDVKCNLKNVHVASLTEFKYLKRESYDMFKSVKKMNDWIDNVMNVFHIEKINEYSNKK